MKALTFGKSSQLRLYNVFEIAHAGMATNPSRVRMRLMLEFKLYGGSVDIQNVLACMSNTEHPNYGVLDYLNKPANISLLGFYGWYRFVLKQDVLRRTTFTPGDSFGITAEQVFSWESIDGLLAIRLSEEMPYCFEYVIGVADPINEQGSTFFIEAQVLGGVCLATDVEVLYYPETDQFNHEFFQKLKRFESDFGIKLISY